MLTKETSLEHVTYNVPETSWITRFEIQVLKVSGIIKNRKLEPDGFRQGLSPCTSPLFQMDTLA